MKAEIATIEKLDAKNLPELKGWKTKQDKLLKEYPFIEITDNKSYEIGKKHRTALLKGRTSLTNQEKLIVTKLKEFRSQVGEETNKLIYITLAAEVKQQDEVKKYESIKDEERKEKQRLEVIRITKIADKIESLYALWHTKIRESNYETINSVIGEFEKEMVNRDREEFDEFDIRFDERLSSLAWLSGDHKEKLIVGENQRLESLRLEKERIALEKQKKEQRKIQLAEIEKRRIAQNKIDAENKKKQAVLDKKEKELQKEKQRLEELEKERLKKIEIQKLIDADKKKIADAKKRATALKPDLNKLQELIQSIEVSDSWDDVKFKTDTAEEFFHDIREDLSETKIAWLNQLNNL